MNKEAMKRAVDRLNDQNRSFFYKEIKSPNWIPVLIEHKEYEQIPDIKTFDEKKIHQKWPVLTYLVNLSKEHQEKSVTNEIISFISKIEYNQNQAVLCEILEIFNNLNFDVKHQENKRLLNQILGIAPDEYVFGLINALRDYLKREISSEERIFLEDILDNLLSINSIEKEFQFDEDDKIERVEFETVIDNWQFEEIVKEDLHSYVINCFPDGYNYVLIKYDYLLSLDDGARKDNHSDYSYIWRSDISKPDYSYDPKELVFQMLINASFDLIELNLTESKSVIERLLKFEHQWSSLLRLAISIYDKYFDNVGLEFISNFDIDRLVNDHTIWKEVAFLFENHFGKFSSSIQDKIIESILKKEGEDEDLYEIQTLRKLQVIERYLKDKKKGLLDDLIQKRGRFENPYSHFESGSTWVGPTSPLSLDALTEKSPEALMEYLKNWRPEGLWKSPTPEGLGRLLENYFKNNAHKFNDKIAGLKELDPTYIRSFFSGLTDYDGNENINWGAVLDLGLWCCQQEDDNVKRDWELDRNLDADPNWSWTRKSVASLLEKKLSADVFDVTEKDQVWEILKILVNDPEPTEEYEMTYGGSNMDAFTLSLNTVRGKAFHAFFQYFLWLVRCKEIKAFSDNKGILNVVNQHIHDHSLAVRSVYGFFFPVISNVDPSWSKEKGVIIFPLPKDGTKYFLAAYKGFTYARFNARLYDDHPYIFTTIINHIESGKVKVDEIQELSNSFVEQIWILFLYDRIDLKNNSLFIRLIKVSNNLILRSIIGHFYQIHDRIPPDILNKKKPEILDLWDLILENYKQALFDEPTYRRNALAFFGHWLLVPVFNPEEKLERVIVGLKKVPFITPITKILPYLESLSNKSSYASKICTILYLLIKHDADFSYVQRSESTRTILKNLLAFDDVKPQVRDLINELIKQEFYEYKDLLV